MTTITTLLPKGVVPEDVMARLVPDLPPGPAVYFMMSGEVCVYIGAAVNLNRRLKIHQEEGELCDNRPV